MTELNMLNQEFAQWKSEKLGQLQIEQKLTSLGYSAEFINSAIKSFEKYKEQMRIRKGWICMAIGSVIGFMGCILTLADILPELRNFYIFGMTSLAVIVAMFGCYLVFEKE